MEFQFSEHPNGQLEPRVLLLTSTYYLSCFQWQQMDKVVTILDCHEPLKAPQTEMALKLFGNLQMENSCTHNRKNVLSHMLTSLWLNAGAVIIPETCNRRASQSINEVLLRVL